MRVQMDRTSCASLQAILRDVGMDGDTEFISTKCWLDHEGTCRELLSEIRKGIEGLLQSVQNFSGYKSFHLRRYTKMHCHTDDEIVGCYNSEHKPICYKMWIRRIEKATRVIFERHMPFPHDPNPSSDADVVAWKTGMQEMSAAITDFLGTRTTIDPTAGTGPTHEQIINARRTRMHRTLDNILKTMAVNPPDVNGARGCLDSGAEVQRTLKRLGALSAALAAPNPDSNDGDDVRKAFHAMWPEKLWPPGTKIMIRTSHGVKYCVADYIEELRTFEDTVEEFERLRTAATNTVWKQKNAAWQEKVAADAKKLKERENAAARTRFKNSGREPPSAIAVEADAAIAAALAAKADARHTPKRWNWMPRFVKPKSRNAYCVPLSDYPNPFIVHEW